MKLFDFIDKRLRGAEKIYFKPDIPSSKAFNAISAYCGSLNYDDVVVLVDDTVFGSAKCGILITNDFVYIKADFCSPRKYPLSEDNLFFIKKNILTTAVLVNGNSVIELSQPSYKNISMLFECVNEYSSHINDKLSIQEPVVQEPVVQEPVVQEPVVQEPVVQEPVVQEPVVQEPVVQEPVVQKPFTKKSIYRNLPNDTLINTIRQNKRIDTAFDFIGDVLSGGNKKSSDAIRSAVKSYISKSVIRVRERYIEQRGITGLMNDTATIEIMLYSMALLRLDMERIGFNRNAIDYILTEGVSSFISADRTTRNIVNVFVASSYLMGDNINEVSLSFFMRTLLSNIKGTPVKANFMDSNSDDDDGFDGLIEIIPEFFESISELDIDSWDELGIEMIRYIAKVSIKELGNVQADRELEMFSRHCLDDLVDA